MLLIRNAEICAPEPLGRADVVVAGGCIVAIGHDLTPGNLVHAVVEAGGRWLWPGFVDGLVHISGGGGEGGFATRMPPLIADDALRAGVTTVIGALGTDDVTRSHADLLATARALHAAHLSAYMLTGSYHVPVRTLTGSIRSDIVLIPEVIGVGEVAIADHRGAQPTADEMARIAAESRVGGLLSGKSGRVLVHVGDHESGLHLLREAGQRHAIGAGHWLPTHINRQQRLLEEGIEWARAGGSIDLTTSTTPALVAAGDIYAADALAQVFRAGIPAAQVTMSSDAQASLPLFDAQGQLLDLQAAPIASLHEDVVRAMHAFKLDRHEVLRTVTRTPAQLWQLPRKGRIAVGADADLLMVDPATLAIEATIAGGVLRWW